MELNSLQIGIISSILTELLKYVPYFRQNELVKALVAFVVSVLGTWFFLGYSLNRFAEVLIVSFVTYKAIIQPVAKASELRTQ